MMPWPIAAFKMAPLSDFKVTRKDRKASAPLDPHLLDRIYTVKEGFVVKKVVVSDALCGSPREAVMLKDGQMFQMSARAGSSNYAAFKAAGWTDALMIEYGFLEPHPTFVS